MRFTQRLRPSVGPLLARLPALTPPPAALGGDPCDLRSREIAGATRGALSSTEDASAHVGVKRGPFYSESSRRLGGRQPRDRWYIRAGTFPSRRCVAATDSIPGPAYDGTPTVVGRDRPERTRRRRGCGRGADSLSRRTGSGSVPPGEGPYERHSDAQPDGDPGADLHPGRHGLVAMRREGRPGPLYRGEVDVLRLSGV